ncbi:MAG: efflux RND transporter periplasmic adaptor subunit [Desulfonatronovibrionaceae bacterium]
MKKILLFPILCLLLAACSGEQNTYQDPPPPKVTVDSPVLKDITEYSHFTGTTSPFRSVDLKAQVSGYLEEVNFKSGERVKKGDLLFVIDPAPYQAKLDQARADQKVKKAELKLAETSLSRKEAAYKDRAISEVEVIEARAKRDKAAASVQAAESIVKEARINLDYTHIHAPFSGRMTRNLTDEGNLVDPATLLATLVDDDPVYAYFEMSEKDLLQFMDAARSQNASIADAETGHPVELSLVNEQGFPHQGHIDYTDPEVDSSTGTIQLRGVFANNDYDLVPGLFVKLRLAVGRSKDAVLVPDSALGADQRGSYVLSVDKEDQVQYNSVHTGPRIQGLRVIRSGLKPHSRVVVKGLQQARPGAKVSPVAADNANSTSGD